jgi:ArsR family transcriptional regulator, arsenate/arsenite/antimonite-responsive transcriptional repressor
MKSPHEPSGARVFRALSDETRLRILTVLARGELCVGNLVTILRVPQPTASRHLAVLRRAGLVQSRRQGLWMFYALAPARSAFHGKLLECLDRRPRNRARQKADAERLARVLKAGGCCP